MSTTPQQRARDARGSETSSSQATDTEQPTPRASHDPATPQALLDFMLTGWRAASGAQPGPIAHAAAFATRRRVISQMFPEDALVVPTGHEKVRSNDTHYPFRPSSDFYYLTGNTEPDCVLAMVPKKGGGHREILFVDAAGRSDAKFFTDRNKGEFWAGPRLGVEASRVRYGIEECRPLSELEGFLGSLAGAAQPAKRVVRGFSPMVDARFAEHEGDRTFATALSEMRLVKDAVEIAELQAAVDSTKRGFEDVICALPKAKSERQVETAFFGRARVEGNDVGYGTIAASGAHACILHWKRNDGPLRAGDLLLLDAGVERNSLYTADVTRTLPLSGRFSREQRAVYELVHRAQREAMKAVRPGADFLEPNRVAMRILTEGLRELGVLTVSADEALREDRQLYRRYTLHAVSHMLGIDVHDCAKARQEHYKFGKLEPGMVLTVEPGLYFQPDDLTVPERLRGIGVRIEDDLLVTKDGSCNLSEDIPSTADDVEAWMANLWSSNRA